MATSKSPITARSTSPSGGNAHFLGIELSNEQLRAVIVDEQLNLVGSEVVEFDVDLPEYQTRAGIFTAQGDVYSTPTEMWVKGVDILFERMRSKFDLSKIRSISGAAQHTTVWCTPESSATLSSLNASLPLHKQLLSTLSVLHIPVLQDTSTQSQSLSLELPPGRQTLNPAHLSGSALQCLKIRETSPEAWANTSRVMLASAFLCSLLLGRWAPMTEAEITATGLWNASIGAWDDTALEFIAGNKEQAARLRNMLGDVERSGSKFLGAVSPYFVERYGFHHDAVLVSFTSEHLATYLSLVPSPNDVVVSFGPTDVLMAHSQHYIPSPLYHLHPHPAQDPREKRKYIAMLSSRNADVPRALVRDMYTKSWSAFDRLVSVIPPGGSIGMDDKLFSFWMLQGESFPYSHVKGIFRFETGVKVNEFRDLRANPRCLLESQILSLRVRFARMVGSGIIPQPRPGSVPPPIRSAGSVASLGLSFDPYDSTYLPRRILAVGGAANFPSVVSLLGDVFNTPVYVPVSSGGGGDSSAVGGVGGSPGRSPFYHLGAHTNSSGGLLNPLSGSITPTATASTSNTSIPAPSRPSPALGAAYLARWSWRRAVRPEERHESFEEEFRGLLRRKYGGNVSNGGSVVGGTTTPGAHYYPMLSRSSTLASVPMFNEEDEDELARRGGETDYGSGFLRESASLGSLSSHTTNTSGGMTMNSSLSNLTLNTSPGMLSVPGFGSSGVIAPGPSSPTSQPISVSVVGLPTDDADAHVGLVKVAEADVDSFMSYAAFIPEYCRLEGMLVKALI